MTKTGRNVGIGIDIGGTNLRFALVSSDGVILRRERQLTDIRIGKDEFIQRLADGIADLRGWATGNGIVVHAVGAGAPGLIDGDGNILSSVNLPPIEGLNLRDALFKACGLPVVVVNDANAGAWGEKLYGAGRPYANLLMLTLGTGLGSGLILEGRLWTGIDGVAGEFGHITAEPDGIPCRCGNRGCLEQYASATAIVSSAVRSLQNPSGGLLGDIPPSELTSEAIANAALAGDELALSLYREAGRYLGIAGASAANLLNLDAMIIGGGMAESFDLLGEIIRTEISSRAFPVNAARIKVLKGKLGDDAGLMGSAALANTSYMTGRGNH
ncbi:MAG: ROK family protein [Geobacteraceae bacterium]